MEILFLIILIFNIINFVYLSDSKTITLSLYENTYVKNIYNVSLLNVKDAKIKSNPSKLAHITDILIKDNEIYTYYSKYFNRIWIFYINNINQIQSILAKDFDDYDITITGILIPKSLNYQITKENNNNKNIPILEIDLNDNLTEPMEQYDIRKNNRNIYFRIEQSNITTIPIEYIITFSIFVLLSSIIISLTWNIIEKRIGPNYIFGYHERIKNIFCAHIFLALTLLFKTISLLRAENYELNATVEVSLTLSCSFYKSFLWFLIYLIGYGWQICFQELLIDEQKKMVKILIVILINFWIDDILEKYCELLWVFHITEIKNLLVYAILTYFILKNIKKNLNKLTRKYNYALSMIPDFVDGILLKMKLISNLKKGIISYLPLYILILLIHKIFLFDYDSSLLLIYDYLIPDILLEFFFVFLMRPKIVPDFYNVDLGDIFNEDEGITYKCVLPKFDERLEIDNVDIKINKKDSETDEIPIIIIGPFSENIDSINNNYENNNENDNDNYNDIDNVNGNDNGNEIENDGSDFRESDINKYFSSIQIGYYISGK